jgi:hypothetical protein
MRSLRPGTWVEVRSAAEILATLDERGRLDGLPFMPEMLQFCGTRFRISTSAHKSCDTIKDGTVMRHMTDAVHLEAVRCDGQAHGGCQAGCLLFWKNAWLKPVSSVAPSPSRSKERTASGCTRETVARATRAPSPEGSENDERYACQATELVRATTPIHWWDPRHYVKDLTSGNIGVLKFLRFMAIAAFNNIMRLNWRGRPYPYVRGLAEGKTPTDRLDLKPGEMVQVRSKAEIMRTINPDQKNRGLWFDVEMVPFCGETHRVLRRVERLIDEKTGKMLRMSNDCIILEDVSCAGCLSECRLFCSRSIYSYWRECWLKRVDDVPTPASPRPATVRQQVMAR